MAFTGTIAAAPPIPAAPREYRATWCATVSNIDWPSTVGVSSAKVDAQKARMIEHLDAMVSSNMNAMYFQVRPACDAMYLSSLEPPSIWLTGSQFSTPTYDPLAFAVTEAHKRGIELHAWVNPYRAALDQNPFTKAPNHVMNARPDLCVGYSDGRTYLDPGKQDAIDHIVNVISDIVTRYDVDGVVFDDYFYPGTSFADGATYLAYQDGGGTMTLSDWRRDNVDRLIETCYNTIHGIRQSCQFEVGPFGIWRPGNPAGVVGADYYDSHYCDTKKWLEEGWVDSLSPQLYWPSDSTGQNFGDLINWWVQVNPARHVMASTADYRVEGNYDSAYHMWSNKTASEIVTQINLVKQAGGVGTVHFSQRWLTDNLRNVRPTLEAGPYATAALRPASTWLDDVPPPPPQASIGPLQGSPQKRTISFSQAPSDETAAWWCLNTYNGSSWTLKILPGLTTTYDVGADVQTIALSAVDRCGNESAKNQIAVDAEIQSWELYED